MDGYITIGTKLDTKSFDKQIADLERKLQSLEDTKNDIDVGLSPKITSDYEKLESEIEKTKNKLIQLRKEKERLNATPTFSNLGKSIESSIKSVGKLVLAIFSIRSAYLAVRRASSDLASYDPQYAANLEYIRFVLTQMIAPVLKWIVSLAGTLLSYIYAILNAWFGIGAKLNLGAKAFQKMKAGASGVSKAVKEIKKELLGFDEINRLTDQAEGGVGAGAGGVGMPDFDIEGMKEVPKWLQWIIDNKDIVLGVLGTIAGIFAAIKLVEFFSTLRSIFGILEGMSTLQIFGIVAGVAITIVGIVKTISALITFIQNPSWQNFTKVLDGIAIALAGVATAMIAFNATNPVGWIILATSAIIALVSALTKDNAKIQDVTEAHENLTQAIKETTQAENEYVSAVENAEQSEKTLTEVENKHRLSGEALYTAVENGTLTFEEMDDAQREVYKAYLNNIGAQQRLEETTKKVSDAKHKATLQNLEEALSVAEESKNYEQLKKKTIEAFNQGKISADEARDFIERSMHKMSASAIQTYAKDIPDAIKEGLNPYNYGSITDRFVRMIDSLAIIIKNKLKNAFNFNFRVSSSGSGGGSYAKGGVFYPSKLPKLAAGGIINQPGAGVQYNGAIIGERGAEAVVPLTDIQQMELLGATIGKYITINANIVNTMNGRVISRELKTVQNNQDFAYNN